MKWIKRLLFLLLLMIILLVVAAVVLVVVVDPNDYKPLIVGQVEKATGRKLSLAGDLDLSVFPWLGLKLGEAHLNNAQGFGEHPFAKVSDVQIRVALLPLFKAQVRADTIRLEGLHVNLAKNKQGVANWDDLVSKEAAPEAEEPIEDDTGAPTVPAELAIGGIEIIDAALHWNDAQAGSDIQIAPFNLTTDTIQIGEPFDLKMDMRVVNGEPAVDSKLNLHAKVTLDLSAQRYRLDNLNVDINAMGASLPGGSVTAALASTVVADLEQQTLNVEPLSLKALGLVLAGKLTATGLTSAPKIKANLKSDPFSPREVLSALGQVVIETADPHVLNNAGLELALAADTENATLEQFKIVLDDSTLSGNAGIQSFAKPQISFALNLDEIDVDRYLPPKSETPKETAPKEEAAPAPPGDDKLPLPIEPLRNLNVNGSLQVGQLKVSNLRLSAIKATIAAKDGLLTLQPVSTSLYGGTINSGVTVDVRNDVPAFAANTDLKDLQIGDLMGDMMKEKAYLAGSSAISFELNTRGDRVSALKKQLGGTASLSVVNGALRDPELAKKVEAVIAFLRGREPKPAGEELVFDSLMGSAVIQQGVLQNDDLRLLTPIIVAKGQGSTDLGNDALDYKLGLALPGGKEEGKLYVPVTIKGPLANLKYGLDLKSAAKKELQEKVDKEKAKVEEKAKEKLKEKEEDLKRKLEEKLKGKLQLF